MPILDGTDSNGKTSATVDRTPTGKSPGVLAQEEYKKDEQERYTPDEATKKMTIYWRDRLKLALLARNTPDRKLDNLSFLQDFTANEDAVNSYLRPKRNDDDVRVVGGTTEKRVESIVNELQSMNWQHEIQSFDDDDAEIRGLGKAMEDCVTRTNQLERDDNTCSDAIWELATQRGVFVEEILEERRVGKYYTRQCRKRVRSVLEVIWGDGTLPWYMLHDQPFVATYDRMSYDTAKVYYGHKPNFTHVRAGQDLSNDVYGTDITFRLGYLQTWECEIVRCMSVSTNEEVTFINGVPMDEPGTPLAFQYPFPRYPLAYAVPKRMGHHVFLGRSVASAMKFLQALSDENVRNVVRKFRQAIEPPRAVKSNNRIYTRDMYVAGTISYGVDADALKPLTTHVGVTDAEIQILNMTRQLQDEFASRGDVSNGTTPGKKQTATAVVEQQKAAIKMIGQIVLGYTSLVEQWTTNRVYNIIETFAQPDGKTYDPATNEFADQFRRFTLKDQALDNGKNGTKVIQFVGRDLNTEEHLAIHDFNEKQAEEGNPTSLTVVNVKKLREMSVNWFVTVASKPKEGDDLHKLMFKDKLEQAQQIAEITQRPLNGEKVIQEYEKTWRVGDWFAPEKSEAEQGAEQGQEVTDGGLGALAAEKGGSSGIGGDMSQGLRAGAKRPAAPSKAPRALMGVK